MRQRSWILLVFVIAIVLSVMSFIVPGVPLTSADASRNVQSILTNIAASFIFLFCVDVGQHLILQRKQRRFVQFFGDLANPKASRLIYPEFSLSYRCEEALKDVPPGARFAKYLKDSAKTRFVDIPNIVSSNDLQGLVIFTTGFGQFFREPPQPMADVLAVKGLEGFLTFSLVSFGLTSNAVTELYLAIDDMPLFTIENAEDKPHLLVNGVKYGNSDEYQHGIILRYRPDPKSYPDQYWFICAGVGAVGTPAAAWHLVHNWEKYLDKYGADDFLIVFKVGNNMAGYRSQTVVQELTRASTGSAGS